MSSGNNKRTNSHFLLTRCGNCDRDATQALRLELSDIEHACYQCEDCGHISVDVTLTDQGRNNSVFFL